MSDEQAYQVSGILFRVFGGIFLFVIAMSSCEGRRIHHTPGRGAMTDRERTAHFNGLKAGAAEVVPGVWRKRDGGHWIYWSKEQFQVVPAAPAKNEGGR